MILKQKAIAKQESAMTIAQKETSRQRRRDKMRDQGNKDDAAMRGTTEGLGWGLAAAGT